MAGPRSGRLDAPGRPRVARRDGQGQVGPCPHRRRAQALTGLGREQDQARGRAYRLAYSGVSTPAGTPSAWIGSPATIINGITPAQIGSATSSASSLGGPERILAEASSIGSASTRV